MRRPGGKQCLDVGECGSGCDIGGGADKLGEDITVHKNNEPVQY